MSDFLTSKIGAINDRITLETKDGTILKSTGNTVGRLEGIYTGGEDKPKIDIHTIRGSFESPEPLYPGDYGMNLGFTTYLNKDGKDIGQSIASLVPQVDINANINDPAPASNLNIVVNSGLGKGEYKEDYRVWRFDSSGALMTKSIQFFDHDETAINNIEPKDGMMIYNSESKKFQGYADGKWVDLSGPHTKDNIMKRRTITKIPNVKIDIEAAREWYNRLLTDFADQKWTGLGGCACENPWADDKGYGWGLQTIYEDTSKSYHAYENNEVGDYTLYKNTDCCVDWAAKAIGSFHTAHRSVAVVAPPGTIVTPHTDQENKIKIHIPIYANDTHWWATNDGLEHMEPGSAYILDVKQMHGTMNCGHDTRVHVIIICDTDEFDNIYNLNLTI